MLQCGSGTTGMQGNSTALPCPTPPPVVISKRNLVVSIFFLVLESIGIHGIVGFFGSILLILGGIKLLCGGIICCRKTKAQEHYDNLIKKGVDPKCELLCSPTPYHYYFDKINCIYTYNHSINSIICMVGVPT